MCHLLCGGLFLSLFPRLPFNYAIIKSGQRDKNKTLRVLFLRKNKGPRTPAAKRLRGGGELPPKNIFTLFRSQQTLSPPPSLYPRIIVGGIPRLIAKDQILAKIIVH